MRQDVDREQTPARFLILGSASPDLIRQSSETLAGRIQYLELTPFQMPETGTANVTPLWVRGGFPRSYLAESDADSMAWRRSFLTTFLERDIPNLGIRIPAQTLRRLWMMLAHNHGQVLNSSSLGSSLGITNKTVKHYLDVLCGTYMIRLLPPWYENIAKRQVKSPKVYFRDSGILHSFLGLENYEALLAHPKLGASWEGFALEEVIRASGADEQEIFFWATHQKAELDLLFVRGMDRTGYEIKYTSTPRLTKSMKIAIEDLKLKHLDVVFPGDESFPLASNVRAVGLRALIEELRP